MATLGNRSAIIGQKLLNLKNRLEEEKGARAELQGELNSIMKQLKDDFEADSLEAAEEMIIQDSAELDRMEEEIEQELAEIERLMEEGPSDDN